MDLILARDPSPAQVQPDPARIEAAEKLLQAATDDLVRASRGMERIIRQAHTHGVSQRRISELTRIDRSRVHRIITTDEG